MSTSKSNVMSRGQAACIVLGLEPNLENRKQAKAIFEDIPLDVCYDINYGPLKPIALGKSVINRNPFLHKTYIDTRPNSPEHIKDEFASSQSSNEEGYDDYSKTNIMHKTRMIFLSNNPILYQDSSTQVFITATQMYEEVKEYLPKLKEHVSPLAYAKWIAQEEDYFGGRVGKRINKKLVQGRHLYLINTHNRKTIPETNKNYLEHLKNNNKGWETIGYARKSETNENDETRIRLLQAMIGNLKNRCCCKKIFVSPKSSSTKPIIERDYNEDKEIIINKLYDCNGTTQDLLDYLSKTVNNVRICIISYAGLSNNPDDVGSFLKAYKSVKEVVIDHKDEIEVLDRASLRVGDKKKLSLFKSRSGPIKRSI